MLLGAHMSIAGGIDKALERGLQVGCDVIQIFTKSNNSWQAKPIGDKEIERFISIQRNKNILCVAAHVSYLINCASPNKFLLEKSRQSLLIELERAEKLKIPYLIMHPGSHIGSGEPEGLERISDSLNFVLGKVLGGKTCILLETTAGQGTAIGYSFEHLREIIKRVKEDNRIGVCYDTCHTFAAGYDIRVKAKYKKTFSMFDEIIGLNRLKIFHFNDSKKDLGSHVDRHEHIGAGRLGLESFRLILQDKRFRETPKILETPKGEDMKEDKENLKVLRGLIKA